MTTRAPGNGRPHACAQAANFSFSHIGAKLLEGIMSDRLLTGLVAIVFYAAALTSAPAQSVPTGGAPASVHQANALTARIRAYHRGPGSWRNAGPPPPGYCATMSAGEFALK